MSISKIKEHNTLEFKADFFPITVIKLTNNDLTSIKSQIATTLIAAPQYFKNAPAVIDVQSVNVSHHTIDLTAICQLLNDQGMIPVGIRGLDSSEEPMALSNRLAIMKTAKPAKKSQPLVLSEHIDLNRANHGLPAAPKTKDNDTSTKLITTPVRSGQQIYARGGDLIVTAAVNAGGECLADGHIHIYGPLRGKALAGAAGNENARIFCESLEAELVSIAGHYLTSEQLLTSLKTHQATAQIYLKENKIQVDTI